MPKLPQPIISLFCGAGGLDYGFRRERFKIALACDNFPAALDSYNLNTVCKVGRLADLSKMTSDRLISLIGEVSPNVAPVGVIGGPPCQGFSRGNAYADHNDVRNRLPFKYASLLADLNERYSLRFFVFENVLGLLNQRHIKRLKKIKRRFEEAGFTIFQEELNANAFGVAQNRRRLFIVGLNKKMFPDATFSFPKGRVSGKCVRDVIADLPAPVFNGRNLKAHDIPYHLNHWTSTPKSEKLTAGGGSVDGRSFRRLSWDEESPTVAYGNREIHVHPDGGRRLSVHEALLLQGFPPTYRLKGNFSQQVTQVSNAVPPPVARALARQIYATLAAREGVVVNVDARHSGRR
jgi:DNA (cytosine-5)-methyltransferase 1